MRAPVVAQLALLLLLASGCSTEAEPEVKFASPNASPSASEPEDPAPPALPESAKGRSPAAAEAFVRHYFDLVNYAQASGDTRSLRKSADSSCHVCKGGADAIDKVFARGGTIEGGNYIVDLVSSERTGDAPHHVTRADVTLHIEPHLVSGAGERLDGNYGDGASLIRVFVARFGTAWRVMDWSVVE